MSPVLDMIIAFEQGELDEDGVVELFQGLVDTGLAWQLQGFYGRTARDLIEAGLVTRKEGSVTQEGSFRIREHKTYGHGLAPGTDRDMNCPSCRKEDGR